MHNYWIPIMAVAFVLAMGIWLLLLFNADRHPAHKPQESLPHREVIGGEFEASEGGRQLMPIPGQPTGTRAEAGHAGSGQQGPAAQASQGAPEVPAQRGEPATEQPTRAADPGGSRLRRPH